MPSEDKIDQLVDRKAFVDDISFAAKSCQNIVDLVKQTKASIVAISQASNVAEYAAAVQKSEQLTTQAAAAHKELTEAIKTEKQALAEAATALKSVAGSLDANIKQQLQYKNQLKEVQKELKDLQKAAAGTASGADDYSGRIKELAKQEQKLKVELAEVTQTVKAQTKEMSAAEGSYDSMNAQLGQLRNAFRQLSEEERTGDVGKALIGGITELDGKLKAIDASIGNFQRNVGNYSGSLKPAFNALQAELTKVKAELSNVKSTDPGFEKLKADADLLEKVVESVDKTFSSTKQEMRAFTEASKVLGQQFGTTNELFQNFVQEVGSQKDTLDDIQNTINFNSSDTKYLDGIVSGISGIVGAYGAWQAATQLVAGDNEQLQKSMAKLQAILTLVQSLQAVLNAVQTESGAIQTALAAKTALVTAAKKVEALVFGGATTALAVNTVATEANAAAQVTLAEGEAVAAAGAISLRTAIISTGIGALIIGIVYAITKLVGVISDWIGADERAIESQKELSDALNEVAKAQIELTEEVRKGVLERIAAMEREVAVIEARGVTAAKQIALENEIAKSKLQTSLQEQVQNEVTNASRQGIHENYMVAKQKELAILQEIQEMSSKAAKEGKKVDEDDLKKVQNKLAAAQSVTTGLKQQYDYQTSLLQTQTEAEQTLALNKAKADKMAADDARKLVLETTRIESELVQTKNNIILNSDKSTLGQRIEALRSNLAEQKKIALAERNNVLNDPTTSDADKSIARKKYTEQSKKLSLEEKQTELKIVEDYNKKIREADFNNQKAKIEASLKANEKIFTNEYETTEKRLNAVASFIKNSQALEQQDYEFKKKNLERSIPDVELRNKELELLEANHNANLVAITADGEAKKLDVIKSANAQKEFINQKFREFILQTSEADVERVQDYSKDVQALNKSLQERKISKKQYDEDLLVLDNAYAEKSIQAEIDKQRKLIEVGGLQGAEKRDALIKLAELEKQLSDSTTKSVLDNEEKKRAKLLETLDQVKQITDAVSQSVQSILGSGIEKQKQQIQAQIDDIDKQKEAEIAAAEASALTAQEKADKIATINAVAQSKKEALERRQRELDNQKAKQDKVFAIFNVISNTATAIIKAVAASPLTGGMPFAAIAGAVGAAQLAAIIAQPIPKYKDGTQDHIGGLAWVGDGGKKELAITPSGDAFVTPDKPTLVNLPKGTKVLPDANALMMAMNEASIYASLQSANQPIDANTFDRAYIKVLESKLEGTISELRNVKDAIKSLPITQIIPDGFGGMAKRIKHNGGWVKYVDDYFIN